jgi:ATP-dependent RNA helicase DDX21
VLLGAQPSSRAGEAGKRESIVHVDPRNPEGSNVKAAGEGTHAAATDNQGDFSNFPEINPKSIELLKKREINSLFPVQYMSFRRICNKEDLIVRDLTGSGKTLGFCLPMIEVLRKEKLFG